MSKCEFKTDYIKILCWALSYFRPFVHWTLLYLMMGLVMIWCELTIPRQIGHMIDVILPQRNVQVLLQPMLLAGGIVVLLTAAKAVYSYLEMWIGNRIAGNQQEDLLKKLHELGFSYAENTPTGAILSIFQNSVKETQMTYTFLFPQLIYCAAQFIVPSTILLLNQPQMLIASLAGNVLYGCFNAHGSKKIEEYQQAESSVAHKSQQCMYDAVFATEALKLMGSGDWYIDKSVRIFKEFCRYRMGSIFWRHFRFTTVGLTLTVTMAVFYCWGYDLIKHGQMLLGEFIGYSFLLGVASRGFSVFFYIVPAQKHALKYAKHLYDFMHKTPLVTERKDGFSQCDSNFDIVFNNVSFTYTYGYPILKNVSFTARAGQKTAIVGESGSGKSTLFKLIGRFYDVCDGEINMVNKKGEIEIRTLKVDSLREQLGYVFQENHLFNTTVRENIRFGNPGATDEDVVSAAKNAQVHDFVMEMEKGYDTLIGEKGVKLSGGQKQRLAIARMVLKSPSVVLLDEATSALDDLTQNEIKKSMEVSTKGKTVIAIAHRLSTIIDYDKIVVLKAGRVVEEGDYCTLMKKRNYFYHMVMRGDENVV